MSRTSTHHYVSLLIPSFNAHADALVFRPYNGRDDAWASVTYRELEERIAVARAHWAPVLASLDIRPSDVVGFWLTGSKLSDLINSIAVSALGYTPQFFGGYFGNVSIVLDLLLKSGGKALIVDETYLPAASAASATTTIIVYRSLDYDELSQLVVKVLSGGRAQDLKLSEPEVSVGPDDIAVLFHSSGTTGGLPKIIPNTFKMLRVVIEEKWRNAQVPVEKGRQVVVNTLGNLAHIGSFHSFIGSVAMGACIAQSSSMAMPAREFVNMTRECSLSLLVLYATFLSDLIRVARVDSTVADALKGLNQIVHTGVALNKQDEEWAYQNDLKIMTSYGTTETGPMMCSRLGTDPLSRLLRPFPGANPLFIPYKSMDDDAEGVRLYEMVVSSDADDCPPPQLCSEDGYYHSNDLFEPLEDGWIYRGRAGDWIKTLGGFCDTKSIEDNVRKTCADIIHDAVVVGTGRLHVCLVVESAVNGLNDEEKLALSRTIIDRTAEFNTRLFKHERVQDPKLVLVVDKGALPRTKEKGNVQRSAVERMFLEQLDLIAGTL